MSPTVPDADLPIVDAHHHLYARNHWAAAHGPYLLRELAADLASGHRVESTVYVESGQLRRASGPERLRGVGEVEFAAVIGRLADTGQFGTARVCAGIVGGADLMLGAAVDEVLDALIAAGDGRLRGIRSPTVWDADPAVSPGNRAFGPPRLMAEADFRAGLARVAAHGLVYDAWQFYPQLDELAALAAAVPQATIVCGHCGGLVGTRAYADAGNFDRWRARIVELARRPNVVMKLGGLAADRTGFGFRQRATPPTADELVAAWSPYVLTCIEAFGAERCLFESNFPVDACATDYRTLWSVYKTIVAGASSAEKAALFAGVARRIYRLS